MAERPKAYGLTAEAQQKIQDKYKVADEQETREWIEAIIGEPLVAGAPPDQPLGHDNYAEALKDGTVLCKLINKLSPGSVKRVNASKMAFKMMENIENFLKAMSEYGVGKHDQFQVVDLYEAQNVWQVVCTLHALGRKAQQHGFNGPLLGVKESAGNRRQFTDEQLRDGQNVIGLQMGTNQGANASGVAFGARRHIMPGDIH